MLTSSAVRTRLLVLSTAVWSALMLVIGLVTGVQHDYIFYLNHWELVLNGMNPWSIDAGFPPNTYGPLYNLLAFASLGGPLVPKVLIITSFLVTNALIAWQLIRSNVANWQVLLYLGLLPINVITVTIVAINGDNDALAAALVGCALLARLNRRMWWAGVLLGAAFLVKFYPLLLLPFLCLDERRLDLRPAVAALGTSLIGLTASWLIWGRDLLTPFSYGASRPPTGLSPLHAFAQNPDVPGAHLAAAVAESNAVWVIVVVVAGTLFAWWRKLAWAEGAMIVFLACLLVYKVGHIQFYLSWLVVLAVLTLSGNSRARPLVLAALPFVTLLEISELLFNFQTRGLLASGPDVSSWIGFLAGILGVGTLITLVVIAGRSPRPRSGTNEDGPRNGPFPRVMEEAR